MKTIAPILAALLLPSLAAAQQKTLAEFSWKALADAGQVKAGTVVELPGGITALKIENPGPQPLMATVLTIDAPSITTSFYMVTGEVRYEGVEGDGFLEMWNHFGDGGAYFSRTMGETGPMAKLRGTSDWRGFMLPFNSTGAKSPVSRLVVNVHLPARGTVWLRSPVKLAESTVGAGSGAWWTERQSGLIGGIGGSVFGGVAALLGWLSSRGKAHALVLAGSSLLLGTGALSMGAGVFAMAIHQPYAVWYPLVLIGVVLLIVAPILLAHSRRNQRALELRRMSSIDAA